MISAAERQGSAHTLEERRAFSKLIFPEQGPVIVYDRNQRAEGEHVRDYLLIARRASPQLVDMMFTPSGEWKLTDTSGVNLYSMRPKELDAYLNGYTQHIGNLVQIALDGQKSYGFNLHDDSHFDFVSNEGHRLLQSSPHRDKDTLRRFVATARGHDLGNVVSRLLHSTVSPLVFERIFPSITAKPEEWAVIKRAIELHEEKVLLVYLEKEELLTADQTISIMQNIGPEFLAALIADKIHIGPDRVPKDNIEESMIEEAVNDPHVEVNEYGRTVNAGLSPDKKTFTLAMEFRPPKPKHGSLNGRVSHRMQELHKMGEPFVNVWENLAYGIYHQRFNLTILAVFALYPQLNKYEFVIRDSVTGRTTVEPYYRVPPNGELSLDEKIKITALQHGYARKSRERKGGINDYL